MDPYPSSSHHHSLSFQLAWNPWFPCSPPPFFLSPHSTSSPRHSLDDFHGKVAKLDFVLAIVLVEVVLLIALEVGADLKNPNAESFVASHVDDLAVELHLPHIYLIECGP